MIDTLSKGSVVFFLLGMFVVTASAQDPTFSFEASAINDIKLQGGPSGEIRATPGDTITVEIFLRDWSPEGVLLRAYQASIDKRGYTSGFQGTIQPVAYETTTLKSHDNKPNCFIDTTRSQYIFAGRQNFGITDTMSPDYRWMGALVDPDECVLSKQNGAKLYCGTVKLKVSEKANGPFTIRFLEEEWASSLRDPKNMPIMGLSFSSLAIHVGPPVLRVVGSELDAGSIDGRGLGVLGGNAQCGWSRFVLRCNSDSSGVKASDFVVKDGTDNPPRIKSLQAVGRVITVELDRPITPGKWTTITHKTSGTGVRFGSLPGDVTGDSVLGADDLAALIAAADGGSSLPSHRTDLDCNGSQSPSDIVGLIELLAQPGAYRARIRN